MEIEQTFYNLQLVQKTNWNSWYTLTINFAAGLP